MSLDERYSARSFRSASDPDTLAAELERELEATLRGLRGPTVGAELLRQVRRLNELDHQLLELPESDGLSWYGVTSQLERRSLCLSFGVDEETNEPFALVSFRRQRPCPDCGVPLTPVGALEMRLTGHGMVGGAPVRIQIAGPSSFTVEVGARDRVTTVGEVSRCSLCKSIFWQDGPVRSSAL